MANAWKVHTRMKNERHVSHARCLGCDVQFEASGEQGPGAVSRKIRQHCLETQHRVAVTHEHQVTFEYVY